MFDIKNINELIKLVEKSNYPIAWVLPLILIAFLIWRRFTTTEYVTAGKTTFDNLKTLCDELQEEKKTLSEENKSLKEQLEELQKIIAEYKSQAE